MVRRWGRRLGLDCWKLAAAVAAIWGWLALRTAASRLRLSSYMAISSEVRVKVVGGRLSMVLVSSKAQRVLRDWVKLQVQILSSAGLALCGHEKYKYKYTQ